MPNETGVGLEFMNGTNIILEGDISMLLGTAIPLDYTQSMYHSQN